MAGSQDWDGDGDALERQVAERRQATYSAEAIRRAAYVDRAVVFHQGFQAGLSATDRVFQLGAALTVPAGLRLIGPEGSGKTTLLRYYVDSIPSSSLFDRGMGALRIRLRKRPALGGTVESVLRALRHPFWKVTATTVGMKRDSSIEALKHRRSQLLLVDEAHNLCTRVTGWPQGSDEGNDTTEYLREIMDAGVGLVLAGGTGLEQLHERDKYLHSRCAAKVVLANFHLDANWGGIVKGLVDSSKHHDLRYLLQPRQLMLSHRATQGNLRALKMLVVEAVLISSDCGRRDLIDDDLQAAFDRALGGLAHLPNPWRT